jgi:hypothetical protein
MLTCKHTSRLISEGQERQLSLKERINLRLHVWMCNKCRRFEQQIVTMRKIMHRKWTQATPPTNNQITRVALIKSMMFLAHTTLVLSLHVNANERNFLTAKNILSTDERR